jgi:hypothetical protein
MNALKLVLMLAAAGLAYQYWSTQQSANGPAVISPNGFVMVPAMAGADPKQVVVFAPENCPSEKAQQADDLARQLSAHNIPTLRSHNVTFTSTDMDPKIGIRLNSVMNGDLPIVFVKGRGKANPTIEDVLAEYRGGR